jgi:hypothetical protein
MTETDNRRRPIEWRAPLIDRSALMRRLGDVSQPPPDVRSWLRRAKLPNALPDLVRLDERRSFQLCVRVVEHLTGRSPVR